MTLGAVDLSIEFLEGLGWRRHPLNVHSRCGQLRLKGLDFSFFSSIVPTRP